MQNVFNRWSNELLHIPVQQWDDDDYNAMRTSDDYMENWDKRKMVLEYLKRKKRREEMEKNMRGYR